jgi:hypothetical protein
MWFIVQGFKPNMTQPERYAAARRQSLKGISKQARRGSHDVMWFIVQGFKPNMTQPERYAAARRQSLKGISTLARGCHLWWLPRVHTPTAIQS